MMYRYVRKIVKNWLPVEVREKITEKRSQLGLPTAVLFSNNGFLAHIYYTFFSNAFFRETYGVIYGRRMYYKSLKGKSGNSFLLRRNIHRLEKGLISRPRRRVFAVGYIEETVRSFESSCQQRTHNPNVSELKWAHDVLEKYFDVTANHEVIEKAHRRFISLKNEEKRLPGTGLNEGRNKAKFAPYFRYMGQQPPVSYEAFLQLAYQRRSVRWYQQRVVPRELIDKAIEAAIESPSACNRLPYEFRIFDDKDLVQAIAAVPGGTQGFSQNFPVIVVLIGKLGAYFDERDRHLIYIDGSLAAMSLMLALETLGLSSCPINWPDIAQKERAMRKILSLAPDERIVMLISIGFPDLEGMVPYSQKKPLYQVRSYNKLC